ncbi:MAG: 2-amino-4-hydroxy-6-hydroxymethyldihydropteridine diphosphokinase, partial [Acidobacteriota bacterium]|nr:2-amino-4-hydroxy-6-hydroxymethyldihydropteridine diphosphokinase [Acidobacteriota bacterium]
EPLPEPETLLRLLLDLERSLGRRRERPLAPRTLDLDLLLYGDERRDTDALKLPHPRLHLRRFVLAPLAELAPGARHPTLRRTFAELLASVEDNSEVELWTPGGRMKDEEGGFWVLGAGCW